MQSPHMRFPHKRGSPSAGERYMVPDMGDSTWGRQLAFRDHSSGIGHVVAPHAVAPHTAARPAQASGTRCPT